VSIDEIRTYLDYLFDDGQVFEVFVAGPGVQKSPIWGNEFVGKGDLAGWFNDKDKAAQLIWEVDTKVRPIGIYVTLNPCSPDLLARANNRIKVCKSRTADTNIQDITNLFIDIDAKRISGISATDQEVSDSKDLARIVSKELTQHGWPDPLVSMSGNGYHLVYRVNDTPPEIIKEFLSSLAHKFSTNTIKVDTTVFNPARLIKVVGTYARKGEDLHERPHRRAKIVKHPLIVKPVEQDMLVQIIEEFPVPKEEKRPGPKQQVSSRQSEPFDVLAYLDKYGIESSGVKPNGTSTMYLLKHCVFDESHTGKEAYIGQADDGKLFYNCFHNSCAGRTWAEARSIISGADYLHDRGPARKVDSRPLPPAEDQEPRQAPSYLADIPLPEPEQDSPAPGAQHDIVKEVTDWVTMMPGTFSTSDIDRELNLVTRQDRNKRAAALHQLHLKKAIRPEGGKRGYWAATDNVRKRMELFGPTQQTISHPFPLGIGDLVKIYKKNIVIVAGEGNAGKSAFGSSLMYNLFKDDKAAMKVFTAEYGFEPPVVYMNSEMAEDELSARWMMYPDHTLFSNVEAIERSANFADVIEPNGINIIDFLEIYDNFWEIGGKIRDIFDELDKGLAIIMIQKKVGTELGRGGDMAMEKSRLYLSLKTNAPYGGICKINKAKSFVNHAVNPNGMEVDFQLVKGCEFLPTSNWRRVDGVKEREKENRIHKHGADAETANF